MLVRRRGVSTLIGVAFFLLIFMTGFAYYALMLKAGQRYDTVVNEMSEFDGLVSVRSSRSPTSTLPP